MRSIFIHIKGQSEASVASFLDHYCPRQGPEDWFHPDGVHIGFYRDHHTEYEDEDRAFLKSRLGIFPPDVTVSADVSGRIVGYSESLRLINFLLSEFEGVAQDDGDGVWTIDELNQDKPSKGVFFWEDSRRYNGVYVPEGEQGNAQDSEKAAPSQNE